ncbi:hypothetical protein HW555_005416, partial [Spodoptera exigua]
MAGVEYLLADVLREQLVQRVVHGQRQALAAGPQPRRQQRVQVVGRHHVEQVGVRRAAGDEVLGEVQEGGQRVGRQVVAAAALQHVRDHEEPAALQHVLLHRAARLHQRAHEPQQLRTEDGAHVNTHPPLI